MKYLRNILGANEEKLNFKQLAQEFKAALSSEFGTELDVSAKGLKAEYRDYIHDADEAIEAYVRDWLVHSVGKLSPESSVGITDSALSEKADVIAEEIYDLKGRGPNYGNMEDFISHNVDRTTANISIADDEDIESIKERVKRVLGGLNRHLIPENTRGLP